MLESYFEAQRRGDARNAAALQQKPYTCVFGMLLILGLVATSVYLCVFTDTKSEMVRHAFHSVVGLTILGLLFVVFYRLERHTPLPLSARLMLWRALICIYVGVTVYTGWLVLTHGGFHALRALISLGTLLPVVYMSVQMIKRAKAERQHDQRLSAQKTMRDGR